MTSQCDTCAYLEYDEEFEDYFCSVELDEDEYMRFTNDPKGVCPYYRNGDEYSVVRKQN